MKFDVEKFIKEYEQKENEMLETRAEKEKRNPMCLNCSKYFPDCDACGY